MEIICFLRHIAIIIIIAIGHMLSLKVSPNIRSCRGHIFPNFGSSEILSVSCEFITQFSSILEPKLNLPWFYYMI